MSHHQHQMHQAPGTRPTRCVPRLLLAAVMLAVGLAAGFGTMALANGDSGTVYYACVNSSSGTIKMTGETGTCSQNEARVVWNQQGPKGEPGEPGATGEPGQKGDMGDAGPQGEPGLGIVAGTCPSGSQMTGISAQGTIICNSSEQPVNFPFLQGQRIDKLPFVTNCTFRITGQHFTPSSEVLLRRQGTSSVWTSSTDAQGRFLIVTDHIGSSTLIAQDSEGKQAQVAVFCQ